MSKLNTDTNKKEFWKKFVDDGITWSLDNGGLSRDRTKKKIKGKVREVWSWTDQALQQAYQKGRKDERARLLKLCPELGRVLYWDNESVRNSKEFIERIELKNK